MCLLKRLLLILLVRNENILFIPPYYITYYVNTNLIIIVESETKENAATRGKMERLRLIMEEKRERRRAGRSVPYDKSKSGTQWSAKSETQSVAPQDPPADPTLPPEQVVV